MKKPALLFGLALASLAACAQTAPDITAAYSGMKFKVPSSPVIVGSIGANNDTLLIKYSETVGEQYIALGTENSLDTGGCQWAEFFKAAESETNSHGCEKASVESFRRVFVDGAEVGSWESSNTTYHYFLSDEGSSFVFFESGNGNLIKLESDFLDDNGFRQVLGF